MPVSDRKMTLTVPCHDNAEFSNSLRGVGAGRERKGAAVREFPMCENHTRLFEQIDVELVQDAWAPTFTAKPIRLLP
ncbi:MAG: hypothetical protein L3K17_02325 [Thermoplasmata archaeon]|nr:hypothetical protein [Thermoplasmata archaeon]